MARSYKKNKIIKDSSTYNKRLGNRKFRRKSKQKMKNIDDDTILPIDKSEVINDYDVCDWKFFLQELWWCVWTQEFIESKKLKGKNKKLFK